MVYLNVILRLAFLLFFLSASVVSQASQDPPSTSYTCSSSQPCSIGCCSKSGFCGLGPTFCGAGNCTSSCNAKSECDPGWGPQWSNAEKCPLNVCCSQYGFCGTTSDFCGNGTSVGGRSIGYYEGWSMSRVCDGMAPEAIPAGAYTHLNYGFAYIDPQSFAVAPMSESDLGLYPRFTGLKANDPGLQTWISIGGWSMNDAGQPTAGTFSNLAGSTSAQSAFFQSLIQFMQTYGFDGVDIDWEYPVAPDRSGNPADFENYPTFLSSLKATLSANGHDYGLTITVPSSYWYMQNFDIIKISNIIDWFNVMTYDLHGTWDSTDPFIGPYVYAHTNLTEIDQTLDLFWRNNIDPSKINLGLGFYGRSFTLSDPSCTAPGCPFSAGGEPGPCSASAGTLMDVEIEAILAAGATATLDATAAVMQIVWDTNQWVSYDDAETIGMKIDYANNLCLGGTMVWAVSTDDANGTAAGALAAANGLSQKSSLFGYGNGMPTQPTLSQCIWGGCDLPCPPGTSPAQIGQGESASNAAIYSGCFNGRSRNYCCPTNNVPTCQWQGTAPLCRDSQCPTGQVSVATDSSGNGHSCTFNHKSLCCTASTADAAAGQCEWVGTAPSCSANGKSASCPSNYPEMLTNSSNGAGGEATCITGLKSLCCTDPIPYQNCYWTTTTRQGGAPNICATGCNPGEQIVAESSFDHYSDYICASNTASFFCCDEFTISPPSLNPPNFCSAPDSAYVETGDPDPDGNPADIIELFYYEDACYPVPNSGDPDDDSYPTDPYSKRRGLPFDLNVFFDSKNPKRSPAWPAGGRNIGFPKVCNEDGECVNILSPDDDHDYQYLLGLFSNISYPKLEPRGRVAKMCSSTGATSQFSAKNYASTSSLFLNGRKFYGVVKSGARTALCQGLPLILGERQLGMNYVTEHVTELQTPAQLGNALMSGKLPSGATAPGGSYDWTKVFGQNGYIFMTWAQLGIPQPSNLPGNSPADALYTLLGSSGDINNLQILDAATNSLKTAAWQQFTNIISQSRFRLAGPQQQVEFINRLYQTLPGYLNAEGPQASLTYGYNAIKNVMLALDQAASTGTVEGPAYTSFYICARTFYTDLFFEIQQNLQSFILGKLPGMITYWQSSPAIRQFSQAGAAAVVTALQQKQNNIGTDVVIQTGFIT